MKIKLLKLLWSVLSKKVYYLNLTATANNQSFVFSVKQEARTEREAKLLFHAHNLNNIPFYVKSVDKLGSNRSFLMNSNYVARVNITINKTNILLPIQINGRSKSSVRFIIEKTILPQIEFKFNKILCLGKASKFNNIK